MQAKLHSVFYTFKLTGTKPADTVAEPCCTTQCEIKAVNKHTKQGNLFKDVSSSFSGQIDVMDQVTGHLKLY